MSLFGTRSSSNNPFFGEFGPMFRLMDDYASHIASRENTSSSSNSISNGGGIFKSSPLKTFQPKFDVKETKENYELHGELPGIEQKNIQIEFTDPQTLTIKGRTEHFREEGTRPSGLISEPGEQQQGKITAGGEGGNSYHKPSVEDESSQQQQETSVQKSSSSGDNNGNNNNKSTSRYWVSERSVGEFSRTFAFPTRVDQDSVRASLKDGILSIVIPKAAAPVSKRIQIE